MGLLEWWFGDIFFLSNLTLLDLVFINHVLNPTLLDLVFINTVLNPSLLENKDFI